MGLSMSHGPPKKKKKKKKAIALIQAAVERTANDLRDVEWAAADAE